MRAMLLEAAVLTAAQMQARGFLQRVVDEEALEAEIAACMQRIVPLAPQAARMNKQTLRALQAPWPEALEPLCAQAYDYAASAEHREGIASFLAKRPAAFTLSIS